jgi:hypothetical protein
MAIIVADQDVLRRQPERVEGFLQNRGSKDRTHKNADYSPKHSVLKLSGPLRQNHSGLQSVLLE